ncbi:MAG: ABC transporter [Legionellales bacterium]|nr:ABC transporter [Legionellales bacterium]
MLEIKDCTFSYPSKHSNRLALDRINLSVESGEFFGLLGENGAGKTTLIQLITSIHTLQVGDILVEGCSLKHDALSAKAQMGWVPQEFNFNGFQTLEYMLLNNAGYFGISRRQARKRMTFLLESLGLLDRKDMKIHQLSGGLKRRLMIVRALMHAPRLILLDEPTVGIDVTMREETWRFLEYLNESEGVTVVLTSHYLEEIERLCQTVGILNQGTLIQSGPLSDLFKDLVRELIHIQLNQPLPEGLVIAGQSGYDENDHILTIMTDPQRRIDQVVLELSTHSIGVTRIWSETTRLAHLMKQWMKSS